MDNKHRKYRRVIMLCYDFARQLSYHRALNRFKNQDDGRFNLNFWTSVYNNAIDIAVLEWCYFFKSHKDDLHWKLIVDDVDTFREGLLEHLNFNFNEWNDYRETILVYRDKGIAHHELKDSIDIPDMTIALNATGYYLNHVIGMLPKLSMYDNLPHDLIEYYEKSYQQLEKILSIAYHSTRKLLEEYGKFALKLIK